MPRDSSKRKVNDKAKSCMMIYYPYRIHYIHITLIRTMVHLTPISSVFNRYSKALDLKFLLTERSEILGIFFLLHMIMKPES